MTESEAEEERKVELRVTLVFPWRRRKPRPLIDSDVIPIDIARRRFSLRAVEDQEQQR